METIGESPSNACMGSHIITKHSAPTRRGEAHLFKESGEIFVILSPALKISKLILKQHECLIFQLLDQLLFLIIIH